MLPVLRNDLAFALRFRASFPPDTDGQTPLIAQPQPGRIVASLGQLTRHAEAAHERTSRAPPPGHVEKHNAVRPLEPEVERLLVVAVGDPRLASEHPVLLLAPLTLRWCNPAGRPEEEVEMNNGQASLGGERDRERALSGPGQPSDYDAASERQRGFTHLLQCLSRADLGCPSVRDDPPRSRARLRGCRRCAARLSGSVALGR